MSAKIGGKIVLDGESQYRAALKGIKEDQKMLRSEMKLCQTTFRDNQNSLEALTKKHEILTKQVESQTEKIDVNKQAVAKASDMQKSAAEKIEDLKTALDNAEKQMLDMADSSDSTTEAIEAQNKIISDLKEKLGDAEVKYSSASSKVAYYQTALNDAEAEMQDMQRELDTTSKYIKEAETSADKCAVSIDEYGKEVFGAAEETSVFGDVLKANLLSEAIISGIKKLADGIKEISSATVETGSEFEASMSQVAATMGMTADEVRNGSAEYTLLADTAKKCGKETIFSASEAGDALNYLALAGYNAEKSAATLPKVLDLAAAGNLDLAYASDLVTDSMAALGKETNEIDAYIDKMVRTSQKSNTSVAQLGEATLVCAGTVSLTKQSLETMNTELGILANNGYKGAEGGTHLRNIILSLSAPTDAAAETMKELGFQVSDSQGNMRDMNDILVDMNAAMEGMSSTEKTQMISRIFNKTDIAAVNALLKGTGDEYDNLYKEISNCSGAAADMAETLNDNLKGKVTILQSALEGLGISAYEIFDDEMKDAVQSATDAVGKLQGSIDSGDMGVSLRKFSESLGELVEGTIDFGGEALPVVIDGLTWILDHHTLIEAGIAGIVAANIQMKVVAPIVEGTTIAWNAYKTANNGATVSQWLLNTAMNANPAGILVTAVVGLTAALSAYVILNKDNISSMDDTTRATKDLVESSRELNESYKNAVTERKTSRESMENEALHCRKLVTELEALQYKTSLTTAEQTRQRMIVDELNQAMPELNLAIDDQTGKLNMSTSALKENVEAMMKSAKAEAAREDLIRIAEEQYEAEKRLYELQEQKLEQDEQVTESENGKIQVYHQARLAQKDLEEQILETQESINNFSSEYEETLNYISATGVWEDTSEAVKGMGEAADAVGDSFEQMSAEVQEKLAEMQTTFTETIENQIDLFAKFNGEMTLTTDEMLSNMQSQIDGITQWADNLAVLADRGINQGLLKILEDMGPSGAGYVATFVQMTDEELQKANELYAESIILTSEAAESAVESYVTAGEKAKEGFGEGLAGDSEEEEEPSLLISEEETEAVRESYAEAGGMAGEGFKEGVEESVESVNESVQEAGEEVLEQMRETLEIEEHSKQTEAMGKLFDAGLEAGIKEDKPNVINTVAQICQEIISTSRTILQTSTFIDIGRQIPSGLEIGIRSGKSGVVNAIVEMCTAAVESAKATLDIHSPSKKFDYMGEMSGEGYIGGWKRSMSNIDAIIAASMPETSLRPANFYPVADNRGENIHNSEGKNIEVNQEINIYSQTDDLIEASRKFKKAQQEAATAW